jgi:hypothetical protein
VGQCFLGQTLRVARGCFGPGNEVLCPLAGHPHPPVWSTLVTNSAPQSARLATARTLDRASRNYNSEGPSSSDSKLRVVRVRPLTGPEAAAAPQNAAAVGWTRRRSKD